MAEDAPKYTPTPWKVRRDEAGETDIITDEPSPWSICVMQECCDERGFGDDTEDRANAEFIVKAVNSHEALVDACKFVKSFLAKLEDNDGGYYDPLTEARKKFHAPLHAKLDAAIKLAED